MIEFVCEPGDYGVIPAPVPAKETISPWFRKLPPINKAHVDAATRGLTVKRCLPFLDAMIVGWIIPLAAEVELMVSEGGGKLDAKWRPGRPMLSTHPAWQVEGHPRAGRPMMKFHTYWTVKTPPGWSCLFVPPLNKVNDVFELASGVVDTDKHHTPLQFPFVSIAPDGVYILNAGMPLVQVIPFFRETTYLDYAVRSETEIETAARHDIDAAVQVSDGWYRHHARAKIRTEHTEDRRDS